MIRPVDTLLSITRKPEEPARKDPQVATRPRERVDDRSLASSIRADGGLSFLQGRLQEKLESLFDKAAEKNPELAAKGPAAFLDTGMDVSPEATADRVVSFALGLKGVFARQHEELSRDELMTRFETEIRRGIEDGFDHARSVLGNLGFLAGDVQGNVDLTWDLVQQKLEEAFRPASDEESPDGE